MPYALWTRTAVAQLIEQRFGIVLAVRTMGLYLKRWGFTPQNGMCQ
jgi:transposase